MSTELYAALQHNHSVLTQAVSLYCVLASHMGAGDGLEPVCN